MKIRRREFLGNAVTGAAGALTPGELLKAAPAGTASSVPTGMVPLGKQSKLTVSRLGIGTGMRAWMRESNHTRLGREKFEATLRYGYDQGLRLFDMADLYGAHEYVARVLAGKPRESYTLVSKIWFHPRGLPEKERPDADVVVKRFLKELKTDYIDLVQIHCMSKRDWPRQMRKQMDLMEGLKEKGLIRAHGVSCHSIAALEAAAEEPWVDVVHARINPYATKMDGPPEKVVPALRKIHNAGKGIIGMKLIGEGTFGNNPEKRARSVRFVVGLGFVNTMIVGFERPKEIDEFVTRVRKALARQATA